MESCLFFRFRINSFSCFFLWISFKSNYFTLSKKYLKSKLPLYTDDLLSFEAPELPLILKSLVLLSKCFLMFLFCQKNQLLEYWSLCKCHWRPFTNELCSILFCLNSCLALFKISFSLYIELREVLV